MTLSELKKFIQTQTAQLEGNTEFEHADPLLKRIITECQEIKIPLWLWNLPLDEHLKLQLETNRNCCMTCKIGFPQRNGKEFPFFPYQKTWFDYITSGTKEIQDIERQYPERKQRLLIEKATGIGATEWFLRYIVWKSIIDPAWKHGRVCIVTGPRLDLSVTLIQRIKNLFQQSAAIQEKYGSNPRFDSRETVVFMGSTKIEAFPSNNQQSLRGLTNVKMLILDEFAHFSRPDMQRESLTIAERMRTKENTAVVAISTPGLYLHQDLMYELLHEPDPTWHVISQDYTIAMKAGLYTPQQIEEAKRSRSFPREFQLKWGSGALGSFLQPKVIDDILASSMGYDPDDEIIWNNDLVRNEEIISYAGADFGYGSSSNSAITVIQILDDRNTIRVVYSKEFQQYTPNDLIDVLNEVMHRYKPRNVFMDASSPSTIRAAKTALHWVRDSVDYEYVINRNRKLPSYLHDEKHYGKVMAEILTTQKSMVLCPVNFGIAHKFLTNHARELCSQTPNIMQISPKFTELINSIQSAVIDDNEKYIKSASNYSDIFDSWRLALAGVNLASAVNR